MGNGPPSVASSALTSVVDAGSQIARSISLSSSRSDVLDRRQKTRHEVMLPAFLITDVTDVLVTSSGALVVG